MSSRSSKRNSKRKSASAPRIDATEASTDKSPSLSSVSAVISETSVDTEPDSSLTVSLTSVSRIESDDSSFTVNVATEEEADVTGTEKVVDVTQEPIVDAPQADDSVIVADVSVADATKGDTTEEYASEGETDVPEGVVSSAPVVETTLSEEEDDTIHGAVSENDTSTEDVTFCDATEEDVDAAVPVVESASSDDDASEEELEDVASEDDVIEGDATEEEVSVPKNVPSTSVESAPTKVVPKTILDVPPRPTRKTSPPYRGEPAAKDLLIKTLEDAIIEGMASVEIDFPKDLGIIEIPRDPQAELHEKVKQPMEEGEVEDLEVSFVSDSKEDLEKELKDDNSSVNADYLDSDEEELVADISKPDSPKQIPSRQEVLKQIEIIMAKISSEGMVDDEDEEEKETKLAEEEVKSTSISDFDSRENPSSEDEFSSATSRATTVVRTKVTPTEQQEPKEPLLENPIEGPSSPAKMPPPDGVPSKQRSSKSHGRRRNRGANKPVNQGPSGATVNRTASSEAAAGSGSYSSRSGGHAWIAQQEANRQQMHRQQKSGSVNYGNYGAPYGQFQHQGPHHRHHMPLQNSPRPYFFDSRMRTSQYYPGSRGGARGNSSPWARYPLPPNFARIGEPGYYRQNHHQGSYRSRGGGPYNESQGGSYRGRYSENRHEPRAGRAVVGSPSTGGGGPRVPVQPQQTQTVISVESIKKPDEPTADLSQIDAKIVQPTAGGDGSEWFDYQDSTGGAARLELRPPGPARGGESSGREFRSHARYGDRQRPAKQF